MDMRLGRDLWLLFISTLLWSLGAGLYIYTWPAYVRELGADAPGLGLLYAISFGAMAVSYLPGGFLADRFDRKWVIVAGWAVAAPAPFFYLLARHWTHLIPAAILYNISMFSGPALRAYMAHLSPAHRVSTVFAVVDASWPLGMVISPVIGGIWAERTGMRPVFWAAFALYVLSTAVLLPMRPYRPSPEERGRNAGFREVLSLPGVPHLMAVAAAVYLFQHLALPFITPFLQDVAHLDLGGVGWVGSAVALGGSLLSPVLGWLADRLGRARGVAVSLLLMVLSLVILMLSDNVWLLALAGFLRGAGTISWSLLAAVMATVLPPAARGRGFALFSLANGLAMATGPYPGGWMYRVSPYLPFTVSALLLLTAATVLALRQKFHMTKTASPL
ncbi:MAG: MFS transporter [Firmicutes bacterium]|nr:MFS transporter [Bacillota bacterium]